MTAEQLVGLTSRNGPSTAITEPIPSEHEKSSGKPGVIPPGFRAKDEGRARILLQDSRDAFYNPAQVINRDLSIAILRRFIQVRREEIATGKLKPNAYRSNAPKCLDSEALAEKMATNPNNIRILEGLAASGLRAIRYALEVEGVARVDANDLDEASVQSINQNLAFNGPQAVATVQAIQNDARVLMLQRAGCYDAVDLDPYGSPAQLLDSAVQAVAEGGLLMVTATDMAVLCGNNGEACWAKYGSYPLHKPYCHEMALRILLACLQSHAARHKRIIVPVLSVSIDFYVRIFVRVFTSPKDTKEAATKLAYLYQSTGCDSFILQPLGRKEDKGGKWKYSCGRGPAAPEKCEQTGAAFAMGGPFWAEPLHDAEFVAATLAQIQANKEDYSAFAKLQSILTTVLEELQDVPFYYSVHDLAKTLKTTPPAQDKFRSALVNAGFRVSSTHANPLGVKTDAPASVVWDVMRAWAQQHPGKPPEPGSAAARILSHPPSTQVDFSRAQAALSVSRQGKLPRFLPNPEANWGPKRRHTRQEACENGSKKKAKVGEVGQNLGAQPELGEKAEGKAEQAEALGMEKP